MSIPIVPSPGGTVGSPLRNSSTVQNAAGGSSPSSPRVVSQPQEQKIVQDILDCIHDLKTEFEDTRIPINDDNQQLQRFCAKLEYLLQCNMKEKKNLLGRKKDYWDYFCDCLGSTKGISDGIRFVKSLGEFKTSLGRGRAFLRFCLMHNRMADSLQACIVNGKATSDWFYPQSLWLQQERNSVLINALYDLSELQFDLAPRGYDLDNAWPSFAKKNLGSAYNWNLSTRSRTSSISSMISIPGQETSPQKFGLSTTPSDMGDMDHLSQDLSMSESIRSELTDKIEALEQQKSVFQQSVAHTQGELEVLHQQLADFKSQNQNLTKDHSELKQRYDKLALEQGTRQKEWELKENELKQQKDEIEKLFEQVIVLEDKISNQGEAITELEKQKTELQFEVKTLNQTIESNKETITRKEDEITTMTEKLVKQEGKNEELLNKIETMLMNKNSEANSQLDSVGKLQETLMTLKELESQNLRLNSQNEEMIRKNQLLQQSLDEKCLVLKSLEIEKQQNSTHCKNLESEVEKLKLKDSKQVSKISSLEVELQAVSAKLSNSLSDHESFVSKLNDEIKDLKSIQTDLEDKLKRKNQDFENLIIEKNNLECEKLQGDNTLRQICDQMKTLKMEIENKYESHSKTIATHNIVMKEKEEIIKSLEEKYKEQESKKEMLQNDVSAKIEELQKIKKDVKELENQKHSLESRCLNLDKDLSTLKECQEIEKGSSEEINEKLEEKMKLVKKLEIQMVEAKILLELMISGERISENIEIPEVLQNSDIGGVLCSMISQCLSNSKTKSEITKVNEELRTKSSLLLKDLDEKGRQFSDLLSSFDSLQNSKTEMEQKYVVNERTLQSEIKELKEDNSQLDCRNKELSKENEDLGKQKVKIEKQNSEQSQALMKSGQRVQKLEESIMALKDKLLSSEEVLSKLQSDNQILQESIVVKDTSIAELREKSLYTEDVLRQNSEKINKEVDLSVKLKAELNEKDQAIQKIKEQVLQLKNEVESSHITQGNLKIQNERLESNNRDLLDKITALQQSVDKKTEEVKFGLEKIESTYKEKVTLEQKLKDSKEKQFDLEQKLNNNKKEQESSQKENQQLLAKVEVERHNLKQHLEDAIKDIESIKHQLTETSTELSIAYTEKERLESEKNDLVVKQEKLSGDIEKLRNENNILLSDVENIQEKVTDFSEKCSDLEEKLRNSEFENDSLKKKVLDLENEINKLSLVKVEFESKLESSQEQLSKINETTEQLEAARKIIVEEKNNLQSKIQDVQKELLFTSNQLQEEHIAKENVEKELNQLKLDMESNKHTAESDLERLTNEHEEEVETLRQEVTALQFQLSSEQIKYEQTVQTFSEQDFNITEMKEKLSEQESLIEQLELEMSEVRSSRSLEQTQQQQELEELRKYIAGIEDEKTDVDSKLKQISKELENEKLSVVSLQTRLKEEEEQRDEICRVKQSEVEELKSDTQQLKKKLIKLIKEKDSLWQKTDQLSYQQKMAAKDKWMDEKSVTQCMLCKNEFSFTVRKHHCRVCGRVFCYQCSDNWIETTHSSKKSRACKTCYERHKQIEEEDQLTKANDSDNDLEDTIEIPKMLKPRGVMNESTTSTISASSVQDDLSQTSDDAVVRDTDHMTIPGQVASAITVSMVDGNIPDEVKERQITQKDDNFHVISDEEVSKSLTENEHPFLTSNPNMTASITISTDELEKGQVNSHNEIWIKPGKTFAVPVLINCFNTTLCWEFSSAPKDVVFAVHYQTMTGSNSEVLIPPCKVESHKQMVQGELTAKQLGVYSLLFDNTYSRLTSKKVTYRLWSRKAA